jgi:hypothetical protein
MKSKKLVYESPLNYRQSRWHLIVLSLKYPSLIFVILFCLTLYHDGTNFRFLFYYPIFCFLSYLLLFLIKKFYLLRLEQDEQSLTVTYIRYRQVNHLKIEKGKNITYEIRPSFYFGDQLTIYVDGEKLYTNSSIRLETFF